jgi:hypothetical protein
MKIMNKDFWWSKKATKAIDLKGWIAYIILLWVVVPCLHVFVCSIALDPTFGSFTLLKLVSLVKVFRLFRLEWIFFGIESVRSVSRYMDNMLSIMGGPTCLWCLVCLCIYILCNLGEGMIYHRLWLGSASNYRIINIFIFKDFVFTHVHGLYIASMTRFVEIFRKLFELRLANYTFFQK